MDCCFWSSGWSTSALSLNCKALAGPRTSSQSSTSSKDCRWGLPAWLVERVVAARGALHLTLKGNLALRLEAKAAMEPWYFFKNRTNALWTSSFYSPAESRCAHRLRRWLTKIVKTSPSDGLLTHISTSKCQKNFSEIPSRRGGTTSRSKHPSETEAQVKYANLRFSCVHQFTKRNTQNEKLHSARYSRDNNDTVMDK